MMRYLLSFLLLTILYTSYGIEASISHAAFKAPASSYLEVSMYILGNTVEFKPVAEDPGVRQAKVMVSIIIRQGENVAAFENYRLSSPVTTSPLHFSDVKRFSLAEGSYDLEVLIRDEFVPGDSLVYKDQISIRFQGAVMQSDLQLLGSFSPSEEISPFVKQGFLMEALPYSYCNKKYNILSFYNEVYAGPDLTGTPYVYKYALHKAEGDIPGTEIQAVYKKRTLKEIDPVIYQVDISGLASGNYFLVVSVLNKDKEVLCSQKAFFIRSNPDKDYQLVMGALESKTQTKEGDFTENMDSFNLRYSLRALMPLIPQSEAEVLKIVISQSDVKAMRRYLFNHYATQFPQSPGQSHEKYMEVARAVDKMYNNGFGYGFESDRGYFFLKYGKPDDIQSVNDDPSAPPYEIWFYNKLIQTNQSNVKFVFYNPSLAENGHVLLHSTARGEWNNPKWEVMLYRNASNEQEGDNYIDATRMQDNWNRHARRFYDDF